MLICHNNKCLLLYTFIISFQFFILPKTLEMYNLNKYMKIIKRKVFSSFIYRSHSSSVPHFNPSSGK